MTAMEKDKEGKRERDRYGPRSESDERICQVVARWVEVDRGELQLGTNAERTSSLTLGLSYPTLRRAQCVGATGLFDIPVLLDGCTSGRASAKYTAKLV